MTTVIADIQIKEDARRDIEREQDVRFVAIAEATPDLIAEAGILLCGAAPACLSEMRSLQLIQLFSVGYSQLLSRGLAERGVRVCNARGVNDTTIAEWNLAMMINLTRDLRRMIRHQEQALWDREDARFQSALRGRVLGIWGYGGIGRETARLTKTLGMTVHVMTHSGIRPRHDLYAVPGTGDLEGILPDHVFTTGQEMAFLRDLDFLVLAMPLTPANTGLVGELELRAMKRAAFLLNPARGALVQEAALLHALEERWIAGAALDTHHHSPMPPEHPLWRMPHVIMTPHISGSDKSPHFLDRVWDIIGHNIASFLAGQPLWNELTPAELGGKV